MKIAVLGWGSLIWDPRNLHIKSDWFQDGPCLPVEFARISKDDRLTLVSLPDSEKVPVLWSYMKAESLDEAVENLSRREDTKKDYIGFVQVSNQNYRTDLVDGIIEWAKGKSIEAVIWTDLKPNFKEKSGADFTPENVIKYLRNLPFPSNRKAEEYIRKAPGQIRTALRQKIENELGWVPCLR